MAQYQQLMAQCQKNILQYHNTLQYKGMGIRETAEVSL